MNITLTTATCKELLAALLTVIDKNARATLAQANDPEEATQIVDEWIEIGNCVSALEEAISNLG